MSDYKAPNIPSFTPYYKIVICSNTFIGVQFLFKFDNYYPLIIGCDDKGLPEVWMYANFNGEVLPVIENNKCKGAYLNCVVNEREYTFKIKNPSTGAWITLLTINAPIADVPEVLYLDFRPLGFKIFGDSYKLQIGGLTFGHNTVSGCKTAFALKAGH